MTELSNPSIGGNSCASVKLHVSTTGTWVATVVIGDQVSLSGKQTLTIGGQSYVGTIDPAYSGDFVGSSSYRLVGGANGWGQEVSLAYHNDAAVKASRVAQDVAQRVGETIGVCQPGNASLGNDYVRRAIAFQVLEDAADGVSWWMGFDGLTNIAPRTPSTPDSKLYHVVEWNPSNQFATIAIEDPNVIQIGSQLNDTRFTGTLTVREFTLTAEGSSIVVSAWLSPVPFTGSNRLAELIKQHVEKIIDPKLYVKWRYRVDSQSGDGRLNLLALSDKAPVRMVPNFAPAGIYSELSPGSVVLLEFLEGDPDLPAVCPVSDTRDQFFAPKRITLGGGPGDALAAANIATQGDNVTTVLAPATFVGTIGGNPATGIVIWSSPTAPGVIVSGSTKAGAVR